MSGTPKQTVGEAEGHPIKGQFEGTSQQYKKDFIQNQLESLKISIDNLAQTPAHVAATSIPGLYWAILKNIGILANHCLMENIDRYDQSAFQQRRRQIQNLDSPITDDDAFNTDQAGFYEKVGRQNFLNIMLKDNLPLPEWCFPPYDTSRRFILEGEVLRSLFFHELKCSPSDNASITAMPGGFPSEKLIDSPESERSSHARCRDWVNERWVKEQLHSYERYVHLPVKDNVLCDALQGYEFCRDIGNGFSKGLALHSLAVQRDKGWSYVVERDPSTDAPGTIEVITITRARLRYQRDGPASLKKEAPPTHPAITNLKLDFGKLIAPDYGIVVAWKYFESNSWMDRYGHLV